MSTNGPCPTCGRVCEDVELHVCPKKRHRTQADATWEHEHPALSPPSPPPPDQRLVSVELLREIIADLDDLAGRDEANGWPRAEADAADVRERIAALEAAIGDTN